MPTSSICHHQMKAADGSIIYTGKPGQTLIFDFTARCKAVGGKVVWGDHFRAMPRKKDAPEVILKCKSTGETLISI